MKGTHNSLSYAKPIHWWRNIFRFAWRCQDKTLAEQINNGVRAFDIRIALHKNKFCSAHGSTKLDICPFNALKLINTFCDRAYVRIVLETGIQRRFEFIKFCAYCAEKFPNITFFAGTYKPTWECLYNFNASPVLEQTLYQHIGSMQSWYGKIFPRLWTNRHKHDIPEWAKDDDLPIVFLDFV